MRGREIAKHVIHLAVFILIFILVEKFLTFLLEPVTYQMTLDREIRKSRKQGKEIGMILIGDSTIRAGLDPRVFDSTLESGRITLNAGTSSQSLEGSFYYLKDLFKQYSPDEVVLGISYNELLNEPKLLKKELVVYDRLKSPLIRADYARHILSLSESPFLLKSYRYRDDATQIPVNVKSKLQLLSGGDVQEMYMGYVPLRQTWDMERDQIGYWDTDWEEKNVSLEAVQYLEKIVELCGARHVKLYLVTMPMATYSFYQNASVERAHQFIQRYAEKNGLPYVDMNLWRGREKENMDSRMNDLDHPSAELAEEFSKILSDIIQNGNDERYLYSNVTEAKENIHGILSLQMHTEPNSDGSRTIFASSIYESYTSIRYSFFISTRDGKEIILQHNGASSSCLLPGNLVKKCSRIKVEASEVVNGRVEDKMQFVMNIDPSTWDMNDSEVSNVTNR